MVPIFQSLSLCLSRFSSLPQWLCGEFPRVLSIHNLPMVRAIRVKAFPFPKLTDSPSSAPKQWVQRHAGGKPLTNNRKKGAPPVSRLQPPSPKPCHARHMIMTTTQNQWQSPSPAGAGEGGRLAASERSGDGRPGEGGREDTNPCPEGRRDT